jgi:hypothetical protein
MTDGRSRQARLRSGSLVVLKDLQPIVDVAGVVLADLRRDLQISTEKCGAKLGDEFLEGVAFVFPSLAAEVTVQP